MSYPRFEAASLKQALALKGVKAIAAGASIVRIGFEDSRYLGENLMADFNYQEVKYLAELIHKIGFETASPMEARKIMGMK